MSFYSLSMEVRWQLTYAMIWCMKRLGTYQDLCCGVVTFYKYGKDYSSGVGVSTLEQQEQLDYWISVKERFEALRAQKEQKVGSGDKSE